MASLEAVSGGGVWGHQGGWECFWSLYCQLLVLRKFLDLSPIQATVCLVILGKS